MSDNNQAPAWNQASIEKKPVAIHHRVFGGWECSRCHGHVTPTSQGLMCYRCQLLLEPWEPEAGGIGMSEMSLEPADVPQDFTMGELVVRSYERVSGTLYGSYAADAAAAELRPPPEHTEKPYHWVVNGDGAAPPVPLRWVNGQWEAPGHETRFGTAELMREGFRYLGPAQWVPTGLLDAWRQQKARIAELEAENARLLGLLGAAAAKMTLATIKAHGTPRPVAQMRDPAADPINASVRNDSLPEPAAPTPRQPAPRKGEFVTCEDCGQMICEVVVGGALLPWAENWRSHFGHWRQIGQMTPSPGRQVMCAGCGGAFLRVWPCREGRPEVHIKGRGWV